MSSVNIYYVSCACVVCVCVTYLYLEGGYALVDQCVQFSEQFECYPPLAEVTHVLMVTLHLGLLKRFSDLGHLLLERYVIPHLCNMGCGVDQD